MSGKKYDRLFSALETALEKHAQEIADFIESSTNEKPTEEGNTEYSSDKEIEELAIEALIEGMKSSLTLSNARSLLEYANAVEYYSIYLNDEHKRELDKIRYLIDEDIARTDTTSSSRHVLELAKSREKLLSMVSKFF